MKYSLAIGAALALCGGSALAGPVGSGLWHTEAQASTVVVRHADAACLSAAAAKAAAMPGVLQAKVHGGALRLTFNSPAGAHAAAPGVRSSVAAACGAT